MIFFFTITRIRNEISLLLKRGIVRRKRKIVRLTCVGLFVKTLVAHIVFLVLDNVLQIFVLVVNCDFNDKNGS